MKRLLIILYLFAFSFGFAAEEISTEKMKQLENEYTQYALSHGIKSQPIAHYLFDLQVNIMASHKFKKELFIDMNELCTKTFFQENYKDRVLMCDVVVIGKVVEKSYDTRENALFGTSYKIRIDELLYGENYFASPPTFIKIKIMSGKDSYHSDEQLNIREVGDYGVFYLKRDWYKTLLNNAMTLEHDPLVSNKILPKDVDDPNVFFPYYFLYIKDDIIINDAEKVPVGIPMFKKVIKRIYELNEPENFYSRKYTENEGEINE